MKIAYLHGLDANNLGPKNLWLKTICDLYDPQIDYRKKKIYTEIKKEILNFNPEMIIGSSMGGFFAYELAKEMNKKAILFNPALHSRSYEPDMNGLKHKNTKPDIFCVFGENDAIINPENTMQLLKNETYNDENFKMLTHAHDTPLEVFKNEVSLFMKI